MPLIEQLRQKLAEFIKQMEDLSRSVQSEDGKVRSFNDDEQKKYDALVKDTEAVQRQIENELKRDSFKTFQAGLAAPANKAPNIQIVREDGHNERGEARIFRTIGEQLQAVYRAETGNSESREKLLKVNRAALGMNEGNLTDGGFLVQSDFMTELQKQTFDAGVIASKCRRAVISNESNSIEYVTVDETSRATGSRSGGVQGYWVSEAGSATASKPKLTMNRLVLEDLMAVMYCTDRMLADASFLSGWINQLYAEEFGNLLDIAIVHGDGAGKPRGFLTHASFVSITKDTSQAKTISATNVTGVWSRILPALRSGGYWLATPEVDQYLLTLAVGQTPVYMPPGGLSGAPYGTLLGRPVIYTDIMPKLGDAGDLTFAALNRYLLAEKGSIDAQTSIHVQFLTAETAFRFKMRVNGQPLLKDALTPYNGTSGVKYTAFAGVGAR